MYAGCLLESPSLQRMFWHMKEQKEKFCGEINVGSIALIQFHGCLSCRVGRSPEHVTCALKQQDGP